VQIEVTCTPCSSNPNGIGQAFRSQGRTFNKSLGSVKRAYDNATAQSRSPTRTGGENPVPGNGTLPSARLDEVLGQVLNATPSREPESADGLMSAAGATGKKSQPRTRRLPTQPGGNFGEHSHARPTTNNSAVCEGGCHGVVWANDFC